MPTLKRTQVFVLACILLFLGVKGCHLATSAMPHEWATLRVPPTAPPNREDKRIRDALDRVTKINAGKETVKEDANVPLAEFTTAGGQLIDVTVVQANFSKQEISPMSVWTSLGQGLVLVNSVDDHQSTDVDPHPVDPKAMAASVNPGCKVTGKLKLLEPGETEPHRCTGHYSEEGITWIDNLAIITYGTQGNSSLCSNMSNPQLPGWQDCKNRLKKALERAYLEDFKDVRPMPTGIIFPAIATGNGKLNKQDFYMLFFSEVLGDILNQKTWGPKHIYLRVDSANEPSEWFDTRYAISQQLGTLVSEWNKREHPVDTDWSSIGGACLGLAVLLFVVVVFDPKSLLGINLDALHRRSTVLVVSAWLVAILGVLKVLDPVMSSVPKSVGSWPKIVLAFLASLALVPISRVSSQAEEMTKSTAAAAPQDPPNDSGRKGAADN